MPSAPVASLEDLLQQARRLGFADAGLETRFREERQAEGVLRSRVTAVVALLYVAVSGWEQAMRDAARFPEFVAWNLHYRFWVVAPFWLLLLVSTMLPGHSRRADWVHGSATVGAVCGLLLMGAGYRSVSGSTLTLDFAMVLLTSVIVLPMGFRALAATAVAGAGGALALANLVLPAGSAAVPAVNANFCLVALVALALGWGRERKDRILFAQREHTRALNAELARLNAEKDEFMAMAAHDLRAPLGVVRGLLELVRAGRTGDGAAQAEALDRALGETGRMHALVNDHLGAHALERGRLPVRLTRVDLGAVAVELAERHAAAARAKGQVLRADAAPGAAWVRADPALLAQVGDNFVTNALKFSPRGTTVHVELFAAEGGGPMRLAVTDEGPGLAPEEQGGLFQKFARGRARPTAGESSMGLGLAVARRLAENMGGTVGCTSPVNAGGAMFWIELPAAAEDHGA